MIMKSEKFYSLLSANQRPKKVGGMIQYKSEGPRTRETNYVDSNPVLEA